MAYWVKRYDGDGGPSLATLEAEHDGPFDTLEDARTFIRRKMNGITHGTFAGPFPDNDDTVECWHDSEDEGCGGLEISWSDD